MFQKIKWILGLFLPAFLSASMFLAGPAWSADISFTDALGKDVSFSPPARRIVVLNSDVAEVLCALGAGDQIIGVSDSIAQSGVNLLSILQGKPTVGNPTGPSIEKIIELDPDLVISYEMWMSKEAFEDKLSPLGIPVVRFYCYRINHLDREIRILGRMTGHEEQAEEYLRYFHQVLDRIQERLEGLSEKVRIYAEGYGDYGTYARNSGADQLLILAGVDNMALEQPVPFPTVTAEWVAVQNPEVIVKAASSSRVNTGYGVTDEKSIADFLNELMNRPSFRNLQAVTNKRVYLISSEIWTGPRAPIGILYVAKWCYPERFKDIDPEETHRQWLWTWHQKKLEGIYVYP